MKLKEENGSGKNDSGPIWVNYFVSSLTSPLTEKYHLATEELDDYLASLEGEEEGYHCAFNLDANALKIDPKRNERSFASYQGIHAPYQNIVHFDFDSEGAVQAYEDAKRFVQSLGIYDISVAYTGNKGFDVGIPLGYFGLSPNEQLAKKLTRIMQTLKGSYPTLDSGVHEPAQKWRALETRHPKSGRIKRRLELETFLEGPLERILSLCSPSGKPFFSPGYMDLEPYKNRAILPLFKPFLSDPVISSPKKITATLPAVSYPSSPLEVFPDKKCIESLWKKELAIGERHQTLLRLVDDLFKTRVPYEAAKERIYTWAESHGLLVEKRDAEIETLLNETYRSHPYNYGCKDAVKHSYCQSDCGIFRYLSPETRKNVKVSEHNKEEKVAVQFHDANHIGADKKSMPHPYQVVRSLLDSPYPGDEETPWSKNIIRSDGRLFIYRVSEGHWQDLEGEKNTAETADVSSSVDGFKSFLRRIVREQLGVDVRSVWLDEAYKTLRQEVKGVHFEARDDRSSIFDVDFKRVNFKNGTLHLDRENGFSLEFKEHDRENYLLSNNGNLFVHTPGINVFNYNLKIPRAYPHPEFENWVLGLFDNPAPGIDRIQKILELKQAFGAALGPFFHQFIFFLGKAGTSKSQAGDLCRMLAGDSCATVDPSRLGERFGLAALLRKNINICTDILANKPWDLGVMKQFQDQRKMSVEQKGIDAFEAILPSMHIFCANEMPKLFESTDAFVRRSLVIRFNGKARDKGAPDDIPHYGRVLWNKNREAITQWALEGLVELAQNKGFFKRSEASMREYKEWVETSQYVPQFLAVVREHGVPGVCLADHPPEKESIQGAYAIERKKIFEVFKHWWVFDECFSSRRETPSKLRFLKSLEEAGFHSCKDGNGTFRIPSILVYDANKLFLYLGEEPSFR